MNNKITKKKLPLVTIAFLVVLALGIVRAAIMYFTTEIRSVYAFFFDITVETVPALFIIPLLIGLIDYVFRVRKTGKNDSNRVAYTKHMKILIVGGILLVLFPILYVLVLAYSLGAG